MENQASKETRAGWFELVTKNRVWHVQNFLIHTFTNLYHYVLNLADTSRLSESDTNHFFLDKISVFQSIPIHLNNDPPT